MPKLQFMEPTQAPAIPPRAYLRSLARILLYRLMPLRWSLGLACVLRRLEMLTHSARRKRLAGLLRPLLPEGTSERDLHRKVILSRAIRQLGAHTYAPVFRRDRRWILRTLQPTGLHFLEQAKLPACGAIILGTHAGLNAWVAPLLIQLGYPVRLMQRKEISAEKLLLIRLSGWIQEALPYPDIGEEGIYLKRLHDLIRQGEWVQHVADHADHRTGLAGSLLGRSVSCCRAPWVLGSLTGAPLIPVLALVDERMRPRLHIGEPIHVEGTGSAGESVHSAFQSYLDFVSGRLANIPWNMSLLDWANMTPAQ